MSKPFTRTIPPSEIRTMPWKNGGGVTHEIATGDTAAPGQAWGWRLSLAEVAQDGPFSLFPGIDRIIAVIEGAGMDLLHADGAVTALEPFQAVRISGDEALSSRLRGGGVRDMNVMVLRDLFKATLEIWQGPRAADLACGDGEILIVHALEGRCSLRSDGGKRYDLTLSETLIHEGKERFGMTLATEARAAYISIKRRSFVS